MKLAFTPIALAALVATTALASFAHAQAAKAPAAPAVKPAPAKPTITTKAPDDWIVYDDATYTPVVDDVSRHLSAARKAFDSKDTEKAAQEMRAASDALKQEAARAGTRDTALINRDKALLSADTTYTQDALKRMNASARTVSSAAAAIENGQIKTKADLDKAIDRAARADLDRRWLVTDVTTWYPFTDEPQRHFTNAVAAYARKDYKTAAIDIRKASGYLRLEAGRATGDARQTLDHAVAQLDALAASVDRGAVKDDQSMARVFASADHALALEHHAKATESWARKDYNEAGYELKAAAAGLEGAASWAGGEAKSGTAATVANTKALGDKLASGGAWTRDEVAKGFEALGRSLNVLGHDIGGTSKTSTFGQAG